MTPAAEDTPPEGADGTTSPPSTRTVLDGFAQGDPDDHLRLGDLASGLSQTVFGVLLFIAVLPAFLPLPGAAGLISGPLVVLVGAQLLVGMRKPWLPKFVARRGPHRRTMSSFRDRLAPWLRRLERLVRPRMPWVLDHPLASAFSGLLMILLGLLLALPIPFTNYLFGALLLLFAFALLERDGALMLVAWISGTVAVVVFGFISGNLLQMLVSAVDGWF